MLSVPLHYTADVGSQEICLQWLIVTDTLLVNTEIILLRHLLLVNFYMLWRWRLCFCVL